MSFPRYPKYKDSGVEWLGEVPEHWTTLKVGRVASIRYGIGEPPQYHDDGTPLIRATNVHAGKLFNEGMVFVNPEEIPEQRIVWLEVGDIVVVRSGAYTGDSAIVPDGFGRCIAGFDMVLKSHSARPEFIQFALLSSYLKNAQIDLQRMRAAQPHLNAEELGSCLLVLPTMEEQTRIAEFLDRETGKIDELVAEQQRLMELLKEKRQAVISHAVTKGLNPRAPMKPSGIEWLGDVPAHWHISPLKWLTDQERPIMYGIVLPGPDVENGIPILKGGNVKPSRMNLQSMARTTPEIEAPYARARLKEGDLVYSIRGSIGDCEVVPDELQNANITQDVARVAVAKGVSTRWVRWTLLASAIREDLASGSLGAAVRGINIFDLKRANIPTPPQGEQVAIANHLDTETAKLDALAAEAQKAIDLLQERRTALISAAVTGQIDVRKLAAA